MKRFNNIKTVTEEKADELYNAIEVCHYCKEPFKECDTIIPGIGLIVGAMDLVEYNNFFWHHGCIFDYEKNKNSEESKL
jgi:hypothetical protein